MTTMVPCPTCHGTSEGRQLDVDLFAACPECICGHVPACPKCDGEGCDHCDDTGADPNYSRRAEDEAAAEHAADLRRDLIRDNGWL